MPEASSTTPSVNIISSLIKSHLESNPTSENLDYSKVNLDTVVFIKNGLLKTCIHPPLLSFLPQYQEVVDNLKEKEEAHDIQQFYDLLSGALHVIRNWAETIPGFTDFCTEDQELLLESAFVELFILRLAYRWVTCYMQHDDVTTLILNVVTLTCAGQIQRRTS